MSEVVIIDAGPPIVIEVHDSGPTVQIVNGTPATINIVANAGPQGPPGAGAASITLQTDDTLFRGAALHVSGITGHFVLAKADSVNTSDVAGLADAAAAISFAGIANRDYIELSDWTVLTGFASLTPGANYFLSPTVAGGYSTIVPSAAGQCVVHIGFAATTARLIFNSEDPILL